MSELYNSICISSVKNTTLELMNLEKSDFSEKPNPFLTALAEKKLKGE